MSYLYLGDADMHSDYAAQARVVAPTDGMAAWYDTGLRLGPLNENNGFVQIEVSHYPRFKYRGHIAIVWSVPHGKIVQYRDTGLMVRDRTSVTLGIGVSGGRVHLLMNGHEVCSTGAGQFVNSGERKYFQVRTETAAEGRNTASRVSDIGIKRDSDVRVRRFSSDCILHMKGIYWSPMPAGSFAARGAFYPSEATFFTGLAPDTQCRI